MTVVIVGAGPTGMMLAIELALAGVEAVVLERRLERGRRELPVRGRAGCTHARSRCWISVGSRSAFSRRGRRCRWQPSRASRSTLPTSRHAIPTAWRWSRQHTERILRAWARELGVVVRYGHEMTGLAQDDEGVDLHLADGSTLRAEYVVGCDGGRSLVRKLAEH